MENTLKMKRSGVVLYAELNEVSRYRKAGFVEVEDEGTEETKKKVFSKLVVDELKALANMLNVDTSGMNKDAMKAAIKEVEEDEETLQKFIDALA